MSVALDHDTFRLDHDHETFRNELASVAPDGRRRWIYARQPSGRFYRARTILSWFLLVFLFAAPFVRVGGLPLILLNVIDRKFVLFGMFFWPQDFYQVVLIALAGLVTLAISTATVGRIWCGWLCPQTVFMEMLFRKIEYLIEGSAAQQLRRNRGPWTGDRLWRQGGKLAIFFALSFAIANTFLAYIIGADALWTIVTDPPRQHAAGLAAITIFSVVFFLVFARFREQACTLACPYGRVMSAITNRHTITVTYDIGRGEPRARLQRGAVASARPAGDCVDCHQCVTVCPTGIDIRNGIQMECVNCAACVDACDDVMTRVGRPKGLIRLTSHDAVTGGRSYGLTASVKAYAAVWLVLVTVVATVLVRRAPLDVVVLRQPGTLYATLPGGGAANFYNVQVFNRSRTPEAYEIVVTSPAGVSVTPLAVAARVGAHDLVEGRLLVSMPASALLGGGQPLTFELRAGGRVIERLESSFIGPPAGVRGAL
ncbi:MAG: cytochrome c oxidase accessory protein CcoG [Acidobacteriota bacterium]